MSIENDEQFEAMKKIGEIVANCLQYLKANTRPGMMTLEIDELAAKFLAEHGAISAPISMYQFPGSVCISVEKEAAHGIPSERVIKDGDLVNIDVSAHLDGWYGDNGESFIVGRGSTLKRKLCRVVEQALEVAVKSAVAGERISNIGRSVQKVAKANKFSIIENLGGHGVGRSLHEEPEFIPSYFDRRDRRTFKENAVVAIEPFLSNGARWVEEAGDGWTLFHPIYYTVQKEHTIMVTKDRPYIFTIPTKDYSH